MQAALEHNARLRVAFTVYSFITLFLCAPAPALGSSPQAELCSASGSTQGIEFYNAGSCEVERAGDVSPLFLPGGDPAARENGDHLPLFCRDDVVDSRLVDFVAWDASGTTRPTYCS